MNAARMFAITAMITTVKIAGGQVSTEEAYRRLAEKQAIATTQPSGPTRLQLMDRVHELESQVAALQKQIAEMKAVTVPQVKVFKKPQPGIPSASDFMGFKISDIQAAYSNSNNMTMIADRGDDQTYEIRPFYQVEVYLTSKNGVVTEVSINH